MVSWVSIESFIDISSSYLRDDRHSGRALVMITDIHEAERSI